MSNTVNIRPGTKVLSILRHIEYDAWFALAEYVDNAIDSYLKNKNKLIEINGNDYKLEVAIDINATDNYISISDNAAGIALEDFDRAFRAAEVPPDNSGLSEFGMGMKSASCWFADKWSVTTKALGDSAVRTVVFDIKEIINDDISELEIEVKDKNINVNSHFTKIKLENIEKIPQKRTISKIEKHLSSIYRKFLRDGDVKIKYRGKYLTYTDPPVLVAPYYKDDNGKEIEWKLDVSFPLTDELNISGFIGIRKKASTKQAGIALFRRGRVIQGSYDETFRPSFIFGASNSYRYQRVFGELHLEGFKVSFTKRGIRWDENMETFLQLLKEDISSESFPLLQQAEGYRSRASKNDLKKTADAVLKKEGEVYDKVISDTIAELDSYSPVNDNPGLIESSQLSTHEVVVEYKSVTWRVLIELSYDDFECDWLEIGKHILPDNYKEKDGESSVGIRLSLNHKFSTRYLGTDKSRIEPLLRVAVAFGLSEHIAEITNTDVSSNTIRLQANKILNALSE